ncbi:OmpA family protein [Acidisphaera sp. L21]|uniref:OmpA family protein n=1 Tax=Acidisphaera sp. L21 TaxID=1641851 RepID=UPI00131BA793|nr:OmpA family protein [Acidisphaera sp. L21]
MKKIAMLTAVLLAVAPIGRAYAAQPVGVVYFTLWSALLDRPAKAVIKQAATKIQHIAAGTVTITGYADTSGSAEANDLLSKLRAQIVIDQLVADGVPAARLKRADRGATPDVGGPNESRRVLISVD